MTTTINNNTASMNVQDTLPVLLRLLDPEEMKKYNGMTPTALDHHAHYNDAVDHMTYQIDSATDGGGRVFPGIYNPEAALLDATFAGAPGTRPQSFISYPSNVLGFDANTVTAHNQMPRSRGSWKLKELYSLTGAGAKQTPLLGDAVVYVTFEVTEPLLLPPFVFGSGMGKQGFYGIQTMNFQMNMLPNANRAWPVSYTHLTLPTKRIV